MANPACTRDKFFLVFASANNLGQTRLGIIASKKVSKRAVDRHRLKRVVREAFRHNLATLAGLDVVVLAKKAACDTDNKNLFQSLDKHWLVAQKKV